MTDTDIDWPCKEVVERVSDYLSGAMSAPMRARFEQHLHTCGPCVAHLSQMRAVIELASGGVRLRTEAPPELVELFRRWRAGGELKRP